MDAYSIGARLAKTAAGLGDIGEGIATALKGYHAPAAPQNLVRELPHLFQQAGLGTAEAAPRVMQSARGAAHMPHPQNLMQSLRQDGVALSERIRASGAQKNFRGNLLRDYMEHQDMSALPMYGGSAIKVSAIQKLASFFPEKQESHMYKSAAYEFGVTQALADCGFKVANFPPQAEGAPEAAPQAAGGPEMSEQELEALLSQMPPEELQQLLAGLPEQQMGQAMGGMPEQDLEQILSQLPPEVLEQLLAALGGQGGGAPPAADPMGGAGGPPFGGEGGGNPFGGSEKKPKTEGGAKGEKKDKGDSGEKKDKGSDKSEKKEKPDVVEKKAFEYGALAAVKVAGIPMGSMTNFMQGMGHSGQLLGAAAREVPRMAGLGINGRAGSTAAQGFGKFFAREGLGRAGQTIAKNPLQAAGMGTTLGLAGYGAHKAMQPAQQSPVDKLKQRLAGVF